MSHLVENIFLYLNVTYTKQSAHTNTYNFAKFYLNLPLAHSSSFLVCVVLVVVFFITLFLIHIYYYVICGIYKNPHPYTLIHTIKYTYTGSTQYIYTHDFTIQSELIWFCCWFFYAVYSNTLIYSNNNNTNERTLARTGIHHRVLFLFASFFFFFLLLLSNSSFAKIKIGCLQNTFSCINKQTH